MKICIVTNIPAPYRVSLFNTLYEDWIQRNWKLKVIFLTPSYKRRKWNVDPSSFVFPYRFSRDKLIMFRESFFSFGFDLIGILSQEKPDIVIIGGYSVPMLLTHFYCRMQNIPCILWSGETILQARARKDFFQLRYFLRRWLSQQVSAVIVYGNAAKNYIKTFGVSEYKIFMAINTVDTIYFETRCQEQRLHNTDERDKDRLKLLYIGHLTEQKGLQYLFQALKQIGNFDFIAELHIIGSGNYESKLKDIQNSLGLKNIFFHGFKQKEELLSYYAMADIFVFPSLYDIWGLVCVEAMACRLPVICSVYAGISENLKHGFNALIVDPKNVKEFSSTIEQLIHDDQFRNNLAYNGNETVKKNMQLIHAVEGFTRMIRSIQSTDYNRI